MAQMYHLLFLWIPFLSLSIQDEDFYYHQTPNRSTLAGIQEYRSALTLDWLAAEDTRQRELVAAFETDPAAPVKVQQQDCISYPRPAAGKVARLMLELLKNLEGDEGVLITGLIHALIRSKLLVLETAVFDAEPDLEALVNTPGAMMGEPHVTFPRILAMVWLTVTDPGTVKRHGWCHINTVSKYLMASKPSDVAKSMRALEPMLARARFVMEEFIQHVTPLNIHTTETHEHAKTSKHDHERVHVHVSVSPDRVSRRTFMNRPFLSKIPDLSNTTLTTVPPSSDPSTSSPSPSPSPARRTRRLGGRRFLDYEMDPLRAGTPARLHPPTPTLVTAFICARLVLLYSNKL